MALHLSTKLPVSRSAIITVPYFNMWTIWWNSDRALHGFNHYWQAPIFFPEQEAFAFSEPQPMTLLVAPIIWLTASRVLAYNVYLLGSLVLNGLVAFLLLRLAKLAWYPALIGGAAMVILPVVHWQIDVLQLIPLWGILWTWIALLRFGRSPDWKSGLQCGLAFSATCFLSLHHALFLAILSLPAALILVPLWRDARYWIGLFIAFVMLCLMTGPLILGMNSILSEHQFVRPQDLVEQLSATPASYLTSPGKPIVDFKLELPASTLQLGQGWGMYLFAIIGIVDGLTRRERRHWTSFILLQLTLAALLSGGPLLQLGNWQPWNSLMQIVPGLQQVRSVFRFGYFVQIAVVLMAAQGFQALMVFQRRKMISKRCYRRARCIIYLTGMLLVFEQSPLRVILARVEEVDQQTDWIAFLRDQTSPDRSVACIPFAPGDLTQDFQQTVRWMYAGTFHEVPLVNGYSGFLPESDEQLRDELSTGFPSMKALSMFSQLGVKFVVVQRDRIAASQISATDTSPFRLIPVCSSPTGIDIYHLTQESTQPSVEHGAE